MACDCVVQVVELAVVMSFENLEMFEKTSSQTLICWTVNQRFGQGAYSDMYFCFFYSFSSLPCLITSEIKSLRYRLPWASNRVKSQRTSPSSFLRRSLIGELAMPPVVS